MQIKKRRRRKKEAGGKKEEKEYDEGLYSLKYKQKRRNDTGLNRLPG